MQRQALSLIYTNGFNAHGRLILQCKQLRRRDQQRQRRAHTSLSLDSDASQPAHPDSAPPHLQKRRARIPVRWRRGRRPSYPDKRVRSRAKHLPFTVVRTIIETKSQRRRILAAGRGYVLRLPGKRRFPSSLCGEFSVHRGSLPLVGQSPVVVFFSHTVIVVRRPSDYYAQNKSAPKVAF